MSRGPMLGDNEYICLLCLESAKYKTLVHRNDSLPENFAFHSKCVKEKAMADGTPIDTLRLMNIPYVHELWQIAEDKVENKEDIITEYMKIVGPRRRYKDFMDSEFGAPEEGDKFHVTKEIIARWGAGLPDDDYIELEAGYQDLVSIKKPTTNQEDKRYISNVLMFKKLRDLINHGTAQEIKALQGAYQQDSKDLGLDLASIAGKDKEESLGQRIAQREMVGPLPEIAKEWEDVDRIFDYFTVTMLYPLLRNFDKADESMISMIKNMKKSLIPRRGDRDE